MNEQFYFYVSKGGEGDEFIGFRRQDDKNDYATVEIGSQSIHVKYSVDEFDESIIPPYNTHSENGIKERVVLKLKNLWGSLMTALMFPKRTVNVIVVSGEGFTEKQRVRDKHNKRSEIGINGVIYESDYCDLGNLMLEYFQKLEAIARKVYENEKIGEWNPKSVAVITHWGGSNVEKIEENLAKVVNCIANEQFKKWRTVASSSTRQEAFPEGFNPFVTTGNAANLPTAAVCEILERNLPLAGKIDWEDAAKTTDEAKLKRYYDRLMLKLNH